MLYHLPVRCTLRRSVQICQRSVGVVLWIFLLPFFPVLPVPAIASRLAALFVPSFNSIWFLNMQTNICFTVVVQITRGCTMQIKFATNIYLTSQRQQGSYKMLQPTPSPSPPLFCCCQQSLFSPWPALNMVRCSQPSFFFHFAVLLCYMVNCLSALHLHYGCLHNVRNIGKAYYSSQRSALFLIR